MNKSEVYQFLSDLYHDILLNFDVNKIPFYFSKKYLQTTDNKVSNLNEFTSHIQTLKKIVRKIEISAFQDFLYDDDEGVATLRYNVHVEKMDHTIGVIEVIALFEIKDDKVIRCNEVTNPLNHKEIFQDIGSVNNC